MPKILNLYLLLLFSFIAAAQTPTHNYNGLTIKVGQFNSGSSLATLNTSLTTLDLREFDPTFTTIGYGYTWVSKQGIILGLGVETSSKRRNTSKNGQTLTSSGFLFNTGYEVFNKNNIVIQPTIGIGYSLLSLNISELPVPSASTFAEALFLKKQANTVSQINGMLTAALTAMYKIRIGDNTEKITDGKIMIERRLPIGFEVGYRYAPKLTDWLLTDKLANSPATNFSGYYFTLKIGSTYKTKRFVNN